MNLCVRIILKEYQSLLSHACCSPFLVMHSYIQPATCDQKSTNEDCFVEQIDGATDYLFLFPSFLFPAMARSRPRVRQGFTKSPKGFNLAIRNVSTSIPSRLYNLCCPRNSRIWTRSLRDAIYPQGHASVRDSGDRGQCHLPRVLEGSLRTMLSL
jgi:hypothetical protein